MIKGNPSPGQTNREGEGTSRVDEARLHRQAFKDLAIVARQEIDDREKKYLQILREQLEISAETHELADVCAAIQSRLYILSLGTTLRHAYMKFLSSIPELIEWRGVGASLLIMVRMLMRAWGVGEGMGYSVLADAEGYRVWIQGGGMGGMGKGRNIRDRVKTTGHKVSLEEGESEHSRRISFSTHTKHIREEGKMGTLGYGLWECEKAVMGRGGRRGTRIGKGAPILDHRIFSSKSSKPFPSFDPDAPPEDGVWRSFGKDNDDLFNTELRPLIKGREKIDQKMVPYFKGFFCDYTITPGTRLWLWKERIGNTLKISPLLYYTLIKRATLEPLSDACAHILTEDLLRICGSIELDPLEASYMYQVLRLTATAFEVGTDDVVV